MMEIAVLKRQSDSRSAIEQ